MLVFFNFIGLLLLTCNISLPTYMYTVQINLPG